VEFVLLRKHTLIDAYKARRTDYQPCSQMHSLKAINPSQVQRTSTDQMNIAYTAKNSRQCSAKTDERDSQNEFPPLCLCLSSILIQSVKNTRIQDFSNSSMCRFRNPYYALPHSRKSNSFLNQVFPITAPPSASYLSL
jgi:hypothetical protein